MKTLFITFLSFPILCFAQIRPELGKTSLDINSLKGKVSQLKIYHFDVGYKNDSLIIKPYSGSFGFRESQNNFNEQGYLTSIDFFNLNEDSLRKSSTKTFFYDENSRLDSTLTISKNSKSEVAYEYIGDSIVAINSSFTSKSGISNSSTSTHKLNQHIENWHLKADGFYRNYRFVYDDNDRLLRSEEFYESKDVQIITVYTYPNASTINPNKAIVHNLPDAITNIINYEYEDNGNLIKVETVEMIQETNQKINHSYTFNKFEYKFDDKNNWTEKREYFPSGKLKDIIKRDITYFD